MTTITEDYVSFEIAKLLKKKGFPQEYDRYHALVYNEEDFEDEYEVQRMVLETELVKAGTLSSYPLGVPDPKCYCCTLQMAMKWLREVHKKWITITFHWHTVDGETALYYSPYIMLSEHENVVLEDKNSFKMKLFNSYEQATEAAIKYCLENLIK